MAAINVGIIPDRPGQLLRQALQERFGSDSGAVASRYNLAVGYSIAGEGIAVFSDTTPTRIRFIAHATWNLTTEPPRSVAVTSGSARTFDAMNLLDQQYFAADMETEVVQRRLAGAVADQIAMQLAIFFRRRASAAG